MEASYADKISEVSGVVDDDSRAVVAFARASKLVNSASRQRQHLSQSPDQQALDPGGSIPPA